jgi:hypothetical protein
MKHEGDENYRLVDTKTTFRTKDTELLTKVREKFPEEAQPEPVVEKKIEPQ